MNKQQVNQVIVQKFYKTLDSLQKHKNKKDSFDLIE